MASSTATQVTANILTGNKPFQGVDYGFNLGMILPAIADASLYYNSVRMSLAKRYNTENKGYDIIDSNMLLSDTHLTDSGDLNATIRVQGELQDNPYTTKQPSWFGRHVLGLTAPITTHNTKGWFVEAPMIKNYRTLNNIINNALISY